MRALCRGGDTFTVAAANDTALGQAETAVMFFPSTKEHTMKRFVAVLFAALLVTLVVTSMASAMRGHRSAPGAVRVALHSHRALV